MKHVAQTPRDGRIWVVDVPLSTLRLSWVLVHNRCSLISARTDRSKVELGRKSMIQKARSRLTRRTASRGVLLQAPPWHTYA